MQASPGSSSAWSDSRCRRRVCAASARSEGRTAKHTGQDCHAATASRAADAQSVPSTAVTPTASQRATVPTVGGAPR